jgi:hypothetical protein
MPRNSSGNYTLPAGNPVVANTLIETNWANPTMADLAASMTDSLDRLGRGSMLAPMRFIDGTVAAPAVSFSAETTTGLYRSASNALSFAIAGINALTINATDAVFAKAVRAPAGTVALPGYAFSGDLDNGWWAPAADTQAFSTAGVERMRINATGVGIGGTPTAKLDVFSGNIRMTDGWSLIWGDGTTSFSGNAATDIITFTTNSAERMRVDASGNVGIGATPSGFKLDFGTNGLGTIGGVGNIGGYSDSGAYSIWAGRSSVNGGYIQLYGGSNTTPNLVVFGTSGGERMRLDASGNVGIGLSPLTRLHVKSAGELFRLETTTARGSGGNYFQFADPTGAVAFVGYGTANNDFGVFNYLSGAIAFGTVNIERMRIDASGNVGIGSVPLSTGAGRVSLSINGTGSALLALAAGSNVYSTLYSDSGITQLNVAGGYMSLATAGVERMRIDSGGNVGIGAAATSKLFVQDATPFAVVNGTTASAFGYKVQASSADVAVFTYNAVTGENKIGGTQSYVFPTFWAGNAERMRITTAGVIQDAAGNELGYKVLPPTFPGDGSALTAAQRGKMVAGAFSSLVVNTGVFARGDAVTIYQDSAAAMTITQGAGFTLRLAGTATTGNRTLAGHGAATILFNGAAEAIVSGAGVS